MTDPLVRLEQVTVAFDDRPVVDRVNLTVSRGDIVTIIGPNGAGKTTLIKTVLGIQRATSGQLSVAPGLVIGYVPQHLTLEPTLPLSVRRFMLLSRR
ncbi:MAG TPA: zinc ABC transporter ATP-binding protein ZnuC, partial [Marinobacter hydrocarbonoclasticus]|nr:zinc ABC transporter ATP-binding protein ZnuC [Marinobacter nauticus]